VSHKIGVMVIVIVGGPHARAAAIGRELARSLRWPYAETEHLRPLAARAADRREHVIVHSSSVPERERAALHADIRPIRFVDLGTAGRDDFSASVAVDVDADVADVILAIRREFGV
jgi:hypothetical protein